MKFTQDTTLENERMPNNENTIKSGQERANQRPSLSEERERRNRKMAEMYADSDEETERLVKEKRYKEAYQRCIELITQKRHVKYAKATMRLLIDDINEIEERKDARKAVFGMLLIVFVGVALSLILIVLRMGDIVSLIVAVPIIVLSILLDRSVRVSGGRYEYVDGVRLDYTPQVNYSRLCKVLENAVPDCFPAELEHCVEVINSSDILEAQITVVQNEKRYFTTVRVHVMKWKVLGGKKIMLAVLEAIKNGIPAMIDDDYQNMSNQTTRTTDNAVEGAIDSDERMEENPYIDTDDPRALADDAEPISFEGNGWIM